MENVWYNTCHLSVEKHNICLGIIIPSIGILMKVKLPSLQDCQKLKTPHTESIQA